MQMKGAITLERIIKLTAGPLMILLTILLILLYQTQSTQKQEIKTLSAREAAVESQEAVLEQKSEALGGLAITAPSFDDSRVAQWAITFLNQTDVHIGPADSYYIATEVPTRTWVGIEYGQNGWDYVDIPSLHKKGYIKDIYVIHVRDATGETRTKKANSQSGTVKSKS